MSSVQIGPILEPKASLARELMLSQNVSRGPLYHTFTHSRILHATRCESCIDRLYTLGPAPCPVCGKTLKKMTFIPQTFEDLVVEKEVSIRRKLAKESVAGFFTHLMRHAHVRLGSGSTSVEKTFRIFALTTITYKMWKISVSFTSPSIYHTLFFYEE
jgi:rRNA maturation protein Nop10